jgi:carbon starvation protein
MPPVTNVNGMGPLFGGKIFIPVSTIACGAISGFHSLVASGTT